MLPATPAPLPSPAATRPPGRDATDGHRPFAWARRHSTLVDAGWALLLLALASSTAFVADRSLAGPAELVFLIHLLPCLAIVWRRRRPVAVFAVVAGAAFVQWLAEVPMSWTQLCLLVALYTVAERGPVRWRRVALGVSVAGIGLALTLPGMATTPNAIVGLAVVGIVYLLGTNVGLRRAYLAGLEERARRLERERDQQARIAVSDERARIARELHDVVAHNISVVVVQADGALWALDGDPDRARTAVATIAETGRTTLAEMRRLLGVLRDDLIPGSAALAPQPGLASLADLLAGVRASGLPVELHTDEALGADIAQGLQLAIYRIVQEALTNVLKHAGPAASARVRLGRDGDAVIVEIDDDGLGPGAGAGAADDAGHGGTGHGLLGMRERAALFGGDVHAGGRPGGGFAVRARLPVPATGRAGLYRQADSDGPAEVGG